jgi:hypothetical protein
MGGVTIVYARDILELPSKKAGRGEGENLLS